MSKQCRNCGTQLSDQAKFCTSCGSSNLVSISMNNNQTVQQTQQRTSQKFSSAAAGESSNSSYSSGNGNGNVAAGIVGAFIFSVLGVVLYFIFYQIGIIAGICGLVMFVLANYGYHSFARPQNKASLTGAIVSVIAMAVMIFVAEYACLTYEVIKQYKEIGNSVGIIDAIQITANLLQDTEVAGAVAEDLGFAYILGFLASFSEIRKVMKLRKK